jgi:translation elongation factor EF-Ts
MAKVWHSNFLHEKSFTYFKLISHLRIDDRDENSVAGMNPQKVGNPSVDEPHDDTNEETCMIYQEFLLDPSISVQQVMSEVSGEIVDFARFEIGECSRSQS